MPYLREYCRAAETKKDNDELALRLLRKMELMLGKKCKNKYPVYVVDKDEIWVDLEDHPLGVALNKAID